MAWLFGGLGLGSDLDEQSLRRLRGMMHAGRDVERNQDANIDALWRENHELKIYLRALIHLMISKKLLSSEEIAQMARVIERSAEPDPRPPLGAPGSAADTSPDLQDLRKALDEAAGEGPREAGKE